LDFSFSWDGLAYIDDEQAAKLNGVIIERGDVLLNITGDSVARAFIVPESALPARVNQHVSILRLLPDTLLPNFLVYTMISPHHNTALMKMAENGATRQAITKKQLEEWVIEYPETIADQQSIVARLDVLNEKCKTLQANYEKTLSLCDDLKQALLRKAFNGEI
jgi:type I restriction enzyme S subunit